MRSSDQADEATADAHESVDKAWGKGDGAGHLWQTSTVKAPAWVPSTNTFALPHFSEHAEWLRRRQGEALADAHHMRVLLENGEWERRREAEMAAGIKAGHEIDSNKRIRRGLERQIDHVCGLRRQLNGDTLSEEEIRMIENTLHPRPLSGPESEALRDLARVEVRHQALRDSGIHITPSGLTNTAGAAKYLGVGVRTLERWRKQGIGPVSTPLHSRCWYAIADLNAYIESSRAAG
jgi:hypothetical protein